MTQEQKERCERINALHNGFEYGSPDIDAMSEFINLTGYLMHSVNHGMLVLRYKHFLTLKQESAKIKLWDEMLRHAKGVYLEISRSSPCSDLGGM